MPITVKHSGNAAPFAAGAFAGSAKRGIPQMSVPAWGDGDRLSRRKRGRRRYDEMTEEERLLEGLSKGRVDTTATRAGFQGPTPVGVSNPNTVAAKAGFSRPANLDGTVNLTPQEIANNARALAMNSGRRSGMSSGASAVQSDGTPGKTWTDADGNTWTNDRYGVPKVALKNNSGVDIEQEKMDRQEFDYKQNAARVAEQAKFTDKQRQEFDQMNQAYEDARKSGDFNESELKEIRRQIAAKQAMIEPLPELPEDRVDPWAQAQKKLFTDPVTGQRGYHKANGDMEFLPDPVDAKREEYIKRYRELANSEMTEYFPMKDIKGKDIVGSDGKTVMDQRKRPRTPAEINQAIQDEQAAVDAYMNPDAAAPTGKFVDANGDTSYVGEDGLAIQKKERLFMTLRSMDQRKLSPEAKAVLNLGEDRFYAAAQEKAKARRISVNEYISIVMKGLTQ